MKNGTAALLAASLVLGLIPSLPGLVEARAEGTGAAVSTITEPSVTAYATSEELETKF